MMKNTNINSEYVKNELLNDIYRLSVVIISDVPVDIFSDLYNCYVETTIYLLKTYPLDWNQLGFVTGNCLAGTSYQRDEIRTNQDLIRCVSNNTEIFNNSLILGMRNFWYILQDYSHG